MNDFIEQLKYQEKLHRKSGANGLADLFMNAAEGLEQQQQEIRELESVNTDAVKALAERNTLVTYVELLVSAINKIDTEASVGYCEKSIGEALNLAEQSPQTSLAEKEEPFPDCDTCGKSMSYMPWHYSKEDNRHLHACDECWPAVNPLGGLAEHDSDVTYNAIKFCLSEIARDNRLDEYNPTNDAKAILEAYEK